MQVLNSVDELGRIIWNAIAYTLLTMYLTIYTQPFFVGHPIKTQKVAIVEFY